jgi:hypothetical protein
MSAGGHPQSITYSLAEFERLEAHYRDKERALRAQAQRQCGLAQLGQLAFGCANREVLLH